MGALVDAWESAALADSDSVGVAVDSPTDPHVAVVVHDRRIWTAISPGIRQLGEADLVTVVAATMFTAIGLWAQRRGTAAGLELPPLLQDPKRRIHALAGALAMASTGDKSQLMIDLDGIETTDPAARKAAVAERVRAVAGELARLVGGKTKSPASLPTAVLALRLVERGETWNPQAGTFRPGTGWVVLLQGIAVDAAESGG